MADRRSTGTAALASWLVIAVAPACVAGERSEEYCDINDGAEGSQPALLIDLFWDVPDNGDSFASGTCEVAGVMDMRWELVDDSGKSWSHGESPCAESVDLCDLPPGNYTLQVEGMDSAGETRWATRCKDLYLVRFDTLYRCDVESVD